MKLGRLALVTAVGGVAVFAATRGTAPDRSDPIAGVAGDQGCPSWSPDGRRIVYTTGAAGDELLNVTRVADRTTAQIGRGRDPAWGPDGRDIVFVQHGQLMLTRPGGGRRRVMTALAGHAFRPQWSADGRMVAFDLRLDSDARDHLALLDVGGRRALLLPADPVESPSFSPDARTVAYSDPDGNIHTIGVDGRDPRRIAGGYDPRWSPDGRRLAFADGGIYVGPADGSSGTRITDPSGDAYDNCPAWSPDGRWIAFQRARQESAGLETETQSEIVLVRADGTGERLLD